jgi:hypothetical protein
MDRHLLIQRFRHIISLSSLAYTFTILHAIQYSMRDHDNDNDSTAQTAGDHDSTNISTSTTQNTVDTPATASTSGNIERTSNRWTDDEIKLLIDYVEANCTLTTTRGLVLKKSEFNKARTTVKTKDAGQCHYKWTHVGIFLSTTFSSSSLIPVHYYSSVLHTRQLHTGIRNPEVAGMMIMGLTPEPQVKNKFSKIF